MVLGTLLSLNDFVQQREAQKQMIQESRVAIDSELASLRQAQSTYTQTLLERLDDFDEACARVQQDSQVFQIVSAVQALSEEINRLGRAKNILTLTINIEKFKERITEAVAKDLIEDGIKLLADYKDVMRRVSEEADRAENGTGFRNLKNYSQRCWDWASDAIDRLLKGKLADCLRQVGWPRKIDYFNWESREMKDLSQVLDNYIVFSSICGEENIVERAVMVMLEPIKLRFAFHFDTDRPTNRLDKPEWFLANLLQTIETHLPFLSDYLELDVAELNTTEASVVHTFIQQVGDMIVEHLNSRKRLILADSFVLLHTVGELAKFVASVRDLSSVDQSSLLKAFLSTDIERWLGAEKASSEEAVGSMFEGCSEWRVEDLQGPDSAGPLMDRFCELMDDNIHTMSYLPEAQWKIDYLDKVIVPLFDALHRQFEFAIPAFYGTAEDVKILVLQANALNFLIERLKGVWGESMDALELAGSAEFLARYSYDASELPGTIYSKVCAAFKVLLDEIVQKLNSFVWQSFYNPANSFIRAMHYAVYRENQSLTMHDDLRRALIAVGETYSQVKPYLCRPLLQSMEGSLLESLESLLFDKVIQQNFFRREHIVQLEGDLLQIKTTFSRMMTEQLVSLSLQRALEALKLLKLGMDEQEHLLDALKQDELDEASDILGSLFIKSLTIRDCETILSLIRD